ncbi:MAG TPA: PQQ-binding-like beta-propeller repeat protein [Candidatus Methanofastidiosa archaeon]|nr:PQQ-binding-like beta-propeller repeat protein [Candidatus Methanofastidiosa archaeon]
MEISPIPDGDSIYIVYSDGRVERRDSATGEVVWIQSLDAYPPVPVCAYGERLYVSSGRCLLRLYADTGDVAWRTELPDGAVDTSIVAMGDRLLVDTFAHNVTVVDAETGTILDNWDGRCDMGYLFVHDDSVYAMGGFCLTCIDADSGNAIWEYIFPERGSWTPAFVDYPYAFISTIDDQVLCIDMGSGMLIWSDDAMYRAGLAISDKVLITGIAFIPDIYKIDQGMWDPNSVTPPGTQERELVAWDVSTGERLVSIPADQDLKWPMAIGDQFIFLNETQLVCYRVEYG